MSKLQAAFELIADEINNAVKTFPEFPDDPLHAIAILGEEYGELQKAVLQTTYEPEKSSRADVRQEAIQTAAMSVRFLLSLDDYRYRECHQHSQDLAGEE